MRPRVVVFLIFFSFFMWEKTDAASRMCLTGCLLSTSSPADVAYRPLASLRLRLCRPTTLRNIPLFSFSSISTTANSRPDSASALFESDGPLSTRNRADGKLAEKLPTAYAATLQTSRASPSPGCSDAAGAPSVSPLMNSARPNEAPSCDVRPATASDTMPSTPPHERCVPAAKSSGIDAITARRDVQTSSVTRDDDGETTPSFPPPSPPDMIEAEDVSTSRRTSETQSGKRASGHGLPSSGPESSLTATETAWTIMRSHCVCVC